MKYVLIAYFLLILFFVVFTSVVLADKKRNVQHRLEGAHSHSTLRNDGCNVYKEECDTLAHVGYKRTGSNKWRAIHGLKLMTEVGFHDFAWTDYQKEQYVLRLQVEHDCGVIAQKLSSVLPKYWETCVDYWMKRVHKIRMKELTNEKK